MNTAIPAWKQMPVRIHSFLSRETIATGNITWYATVVYAAKVTR